jgi:hypothetical protein
MPAPQVVPAPLEVGCSPSALTPFSILDPLSSPPTFSPAQGESDRAFAAFCAYLELGPGRRYSAVARKAGVSLRSIQRWAIDFDWRTRISSHAARCAEQSAQSQSVVPAGDLLDAAARARAFRERQFLLAEAILDVAERYFEHLNEADLEQVRFPDACRALEFASRLAQQARETETAPDHALRDQLAALLDQVCPEPKQPT